MKKSKNIFWIVSLFIVAFYSCSNEDVRSAKLLQKMVETSEDGLSKTTFFTYDGNKIMMIDSPFSQADFTYTDGLISKIVVLNKKTKALETIEYSYVLRNLVQVESLGKYVIKYTHKSDKMISYERFSTITNNQLVKEYHGVLTVENGNLTYDQRIFDNVEEGLIAKNSRTFKYDQKINPMSGIFGFDKLLTCDDLMSINNSLMNIIEDSIIYPNDQITSSAKMYTSFFKYDVAGYPLEKVSETALLPNGKRGYLKTQYFY